MSKGDGKDHKHHWTKSKAAPKWHYCEGCRNFYSSGRPKGAWVSIIPHHKRWIRKEEALRCVAKKGKASKCLAQKGL